MLIADDAAHRRDARGRGLLAELAEDHATVSVHPGPLGPEGTAQLVRLRLGDNAHERFVAACHRTTGGNPLLLRQLLRALQVEGVRPDASHADTVNAIGSRAVSSMVLMRLRRLPADCTAVARAVAVLGDGAELPVVAALAQLDEEQTAAAIAVLARAEVVRVDQPLGFVHPLVGEAVYQDIPPGERELAHERAARVLMGREATPEQVAAHLLLAPRRGNQEAVAALRQAAATAAERGAADAAKTYLQRAMAEPPRAEDRPRRCSSSWAASPTIDRRPGRRDEPQGGVRHAHRPRAARRGRDDARPHPGLRRRAGRGDGVRPGGRGRPARRAGRRAAGPARPGAHQRLHARPADRASGWSARPEIRGDGPGARALAATLSWEELILTGDRHKALRLARFAVEDGHLQRADAGLLWVVATFVQEMCDESSGDFWDRTLAEAYARGSLFSALSVHLWRGHMLWHHGNLREALQSVHTSNEQSRAWGTRHVGVPVRPGVRSSASCSSRATSRRPAGSPSRCSTSRGSATGRGSSTRTTRRLLAAEGRHAEALALLDRTEQMQTVVTNPVWRPWRTYRAPILAAGRPGRRGPRADGRGGAAGPPVGGAERPRPHPAGGRRARRSRVGGDAARGAGAAHARASLATSWPVPSSRSPGSRSDPAERERLLRAALGRSLECGSDGLYRLVAAELVADGAEVPARPGGRLHALPRPSGGSSRRSSRATPTARSPRRCSSPRPGSSARWPSCGRASASTPTPSCAQLLAAHPL